MNNPTLEDKYWKVQKGNHPKWLKEYVDSLRTIINKYETNILEETPTELYFENLVTNKKLYVNPEYGWLSYEPNDSSKPRKRYMIKFKNSLLQIHSELSLLYLSPVAGNSVVIGQTDDFKKLT